MGSMNEHIGRSKRFVHFSRFAMRWLKKARHRWQRRQAKEFDDEDGEHTPVYNKYNGWAD